MNKKINKTYSALGAKIRAGISLTLMSIILLAMSVSVYAGTVTFDGSKFKIESGSASDLLPGFNDMMPGDKRSEEISIKNTGSKTVAISMTSPVAEENPDFLSQLIISVDGNTDAVTFPAGSGNAGGSEISLALGDFAPGDERTVKVEVEMPKSVGNKYQNAKGTLAWKLIAEEEDESDEPVDPEDPVGPDDPADPADPDDPAIDPVDPGDPATPGKPVTPGNSGSGGGARTGDATRIGVFAALLLAAIILLAVIIRRRRA